MSERYLNDSLRLPSYRESLVVRYHPYPRKQAKLANQLMQTVDHRYDEDSNPAPTSCNVNPVPQDAVEDIAFSLDRAMRSDDKIVVKRRRSLTSLIIDLALAVIDSYRSTRAGKRRPSDVKDN
ncbi:hypothetical protein BD414DRAFT_475601 [Trametes punicea]|nr:hypothetical protein BD414DRAFT_475601 [Trametes punicea]